jgi:hypothetical protein
VKLFDFNPELAPPFDSDPALEERIIQDSFNHLSFQKTGKRSLLNEIGYKIKDLKSRKWKYGALRNPSRLYKVVWNSVVFYAKHPEAIVKLQK